MLVTIVIPFPTMFSTILWKTPSSFKLYGNAFSLDMTISLLNGKGLTNNTIDEYLKERKYSTD